MSADDLGAVLGLTPAPGESDENFRRRLRQAIDCDDTIQTVADYERLPGVLEAIPAHPRLGCVTLIVAPGVEGIADVIQPRLPIGTDVVVICPHDGKAWVGLRGATACWLPDDAGGMQNALGRHRTRWFDESVFAHAGLRG